MNIIDIAKLAGVSKSTVSRVINGYSSVDPEIVRKVRDVMAEVGFVPGLNRRGPKPKSRSGEGFVKGVVGLVVLGDTVQQMDHPFIVRQLSGITQECAKNGVSLMVMEMPDLDVFPDALRKRMVDGLILTGSGSLSVSHDLFRPLKCVFAGTLSAADFPYDSVEIDHRMIGYLAADYLLSQGCRRPSFVNNVLDHRGFNLRRDGFCERMADKGIEVRVIQSDVRSKGALNSAVMRKELALLYAASEDGHYIADGYFMPTDQHAAVFQSVLNDAGRMADEDYVMISANLDEPWLSSMIKRCATIDTRSAEIGKLLVRRLIERIQNPCGDIVSISVTPRLVLPE